jgi:hypothetical protein
VTVKFFFCVGFSLFILAFVCCQRPTDPVIPIVTSPVTTKPIASTPVTPPITATQPAPTPPIVVTLVSTTIVETIPPALTVRGCRIVQEFSKYAPKDPGTYDSSKPGAESLIVEGKTFIIKNEDIVEYTYDAQGRLINSTGRRIYIPNQSTYQTSYAYGIGVIYKTWWEGDGPVENSTRFYRDTLLLNSQGLDLGKDKSRQYDADGYFVKSSREKQIIENGNMVDYKSSYQVGNEDVPYIHYKKTYYPNTRALPNLTPFMGRENINLPKTYTLLLLNSESAFGPGPYVDSRYYYQYDQRGLVSRRISYSIEKNLNTGNGTTLYVTDYTYDCP